MKARFSLLFLVFSLPALAESPPPAKDIVDQKKSIKENVLGCQELIKAHCGDKSQKECMKQQDPKSAQVSHCVAYMLQNQGDVNSKDLNPDFQSLFEKVGSQNSDFNKCINISKTVCGEGSNINECYQKNGRAFPSYCKTVVQDSLDYMHAAYKNDPKLGLCTDMAMNKCKLDITDTELSDGEVRKRVQNYQACLKQTIPNMRECQAVIQPKDKGTPAAASAVQLIGQ